MDNTAIKEAKERFGQILVEQLKCVEEMKKPGPPAPNMPST